MTKFLGCIEEAAAAGDLDPAVADAARQTYHDAFEAVSDVFGPAEADRQAGVAVMDKLAADALEARRLRALAIRSRREVLGNMAAFKRGRGYSGVEDLGGGGGRPPKDGWSQGGQPPEKGPYSGGKGAADFLIQLIDGDGGLAGGAGPSVKGRYQAIRGKFDAMMADLHEKFETSTGFVFEDGRAALGNIVREAFGQDTGDQAAKGLAKAWGETAETARRMFNAAGGSIGKMENWGLPQSWDAYAVQAAGKEAWSEKVFAGLDRSKMIDAVTKKPFTDARLRAVLGEVFDTIVTHDAINREAGEFNGAGMLAKRRQDARFLQFKDPDAWLAIQGEFGAADPYAAMVHHLDGMAREIAQLQVLGPNPRAQFDFLARAAEREALVEEPAGATKAVNNARSAIDTARKMYGLFTGELAGPYGRNNQFAAVMTSLRSYLSAAQLGGAVINDVLGNPVFAAQARAFTGLSKMGDFGAYAAWVTSEDARQIARRTGFILEGTRARLEAATRDSLRAVTVGGQLTGGVSSISRRMPALVYRMSGLSGNMAAQRWAFQHEFMGALADRAGMTLDAMAKGDGEDRAIAETIRARGITPRMWDHIRAAPPETPAPGAAFLSPAAVSAHAGDDLGFRVAEMIERQVRLAVPEPSLWAQAHLIGGSRPGTIQGEFYRSLAAYRSFTVTQTHLFANEFARRAMEQPNWQIGAASHAAPLVIAATLTGALAVWAKDMANGNDPRPANNPQFWFASMTQGGGFGILGDFLYAAQARNGKGSALTAMGAPASFVSDTADMAIGKPAAIATDAYNGVPLDQAIHDAKPGAGAAQYLARYSPLSSLWWARAAWDRAVTGNVQRLLDPDAEKAFQRRARQLQSNTGQDQWWPYGSTTPERAPSFAKVGEPLPQHKHH